MAGARSVNPSVKFSFAQVGQASYDDAAGGKRVMQATIASGADVVFGMGDGATLGYIQAVETSAKKVWFIDVIGNPTPIDKKGAILSSVLWDFSKVFKAAVADVNKGTYGTHTYTLGLNNGVSLLQTKYIPGAVWKLIQQTRKGIIGGSIKVPLTPDLKSVKALMK